MAGAKGGRLEAKFTFTTSEAVTFTDSVGDQTVTVVAGTYYLAEIVTQINTDLARGWLVSVSDGEGGTSTATGESRIDSVSNYPYTVTFTSTKIRDILGFTGDIGSTSSFSISSNHCKGLWLPGVIKTSMYGDAAGGSIVSDYRTLKGPTGIVSAIYGQMHREHRGIQWMGVTAQRAMAHAEVISGESFESFFLDCATSRLAYLPVNPEVRLIWDADSDSTFAVGRLLWPANFDLEQMVSGWVGRMNVSLPVLSVEAA